MKMGVLKESLCFCNGSKGKSERMKSTIFSGKGPALVSIATGGTGFLIHRNLLVTTHANLPSVAAAEAVEIRLQSGVSASLFPHRFFITSPVLDLTIVGLDVINENEQLQQPHSLKTSSKPNLDLGSIVYLLGYTEKNELVINEGKVIIATDNLIKVVSTNGAIWSHGSAGFDINGNLAFMICDPMKLSNSPNSTSTSSSSSWKKDHPTQFGIPIPIICDWLNQNMESTSQISDHTCVSFTKRRVFKSIESESVEIKPSSEDTHNARVQTPKMYDSLIYTSRNKEPNQIQLLDINFPRRIVNRSSIKQSGPIKDDEISSTGSVEGIQSGVQSSSSPIQFNTRNLNECNSDGETTMYSADTAESRNYVSPRKEKLPVRKKEFEKKQRKAYSQGETSQRSNDYYTPTVASRMKKRDSVETPRTMSRRSAVHSSPRWMF